MQSTSAIFDRVLTQNKIKRIRRDNPTGLWLEMKECLCSFLSEASVFPHSSDSGMSRWVGTCRQSAPRAARSGREDGYVPPCLTLLFPSGFWVSRPRLRCQLHPCLGVAREPRRRSAARTPCEHPRDSLPAPTRLRLRPWDPASPAAPRLRHGESTICCEALPQLPPASPRASVERRVSGRGAGPRAGTTSRLRAPPPPDTASSLSTSP